MRLIKQPRGREGIVRLLVFWTALLLIVSLSCDLPEGALRDLFSGSESSPPQASDKSADDSQSLGPEATTPAPKVPTLTPSPTVSLTPTFTLTPTLYVEISQNTNCRYGPGSIYDLLHTYLAGDQALLVGKNAGETFWYTSDKDGIKPDCWLWGKIDTPVGTTTAVPIFTPPPTPTPFVDFTVNYEGSDCGAGSCWLWFKIDNTGTMGLESVKVYAKNTVTGNDATNQANLFKSSIAGSDIADIPFGGSGYTHSGQLNNPGGASVNVNVTVCSQNGLGGICLTKSLTVSP